MRGQAYLRRPNGRREARAWRSNHSEKYQCIKDQGSRGLCSNNNRWWRELTALQGLVKGAWALNSTGTTSLNQELISLSKQGLIFLSAAAPMSYSISNQSSQLWEAWEIGREVGLCGCFWAPPQHQAEVTPLLISEISVYSGEVWTTPSAQRGVSSTENEAWQVSRRQHSQLIQRMRPAGDAENWVYQGDWSSLII